MKAGVKISQGRLFSFLLAAIEAAEIALFLFAVAEPIWELVRWEGSFPLLAASVAVPAVICRALAGAARRFWQYVLGWLLFFSACVGCLYASGDYYAMAAAAVCFLMLLFQRLIPALQGTLEPGWFRLGMLAALFFIAATISESAANTVLYCGMGYLLLKYLWDALAATDSFIGEMEDVSFLPEKQIRAMGGGMSLVYCLLTGLVMLGFSFLPLGQVFEWLGRAVKALIRWLFSLFPGGGEQELPEEMPENLPSGEQGLPGADGESGWLAELLQQIFTVVGFALLAAGVVAGIAYIVYKLYKNFYETPEGRTEEREFILPFMREERLKRREGSGKARWGRDPASKVRRLYRKKIKEKLPKKEKPAKSSTPREQLLLTKLQENPQSGDFRELYEKARYGREITQEEAERMRSLSSKL